MLDNIIESIEKTKEKLVSINIYMEKNIIHILLANNIENYLDLSKINKLGYSTKGEKRVNKKANVNVIYLFFIGIPSLSKITLLLFAFILYLIFQ